VKRLKPLDVLLLGLVVPVWAAWFALLVQASFADRVVSIPVDVAAARDESDHPTVKGIFPGWAGGGGLAVGDVLIRAGGQELRGIGQIGFHARVREAAQVSFFVPVAIVRGGEPRELVMDVRWPRRPFARVVWLLLTALAFGITGVVILLKAPDARAARPLFLALLLAVLPFGNVPAGPRAQTYGFFVLVFVGSMLAFPLFLRAARLIPEPAAPAAPRVGWWPWLFCVPMLLIWWSAVFGTPLSMERGRQTVELMWIAFAVSMLVILTRNFQRADPSGRRQIKWVVYGFYIIYLPRLLLSFLDLMRLTGERWIWDTLVAVPSIFLPICILIAIVRYNLFDIDRLWSATASYTIVGVLLLAGAFTAMPRLATTAGPPLGIDPTAAQLILSLGLAALVVPAHRRLRPQIERVFFKERYTLERGVAQLLDDLGTCDGPEELLNLTGERLDALLRPESCVIYARADPVYAPAFVRGRAVPLAFDAESPLVSTLRLRTGPLSTETGWGRRSAADLGPFDRAALETLGVQLVLPVKRGTDLVAFLCLGRKRSGDVYTSTDLALLAGVAHALSSGLLRFGDAQIIREGRAMQDALRRYVPAPIAARLAGGESTGATERDVSALFVDIRGYSTYAEARRAEEVFITSSRFAETVSRVVREHGGTVVEFSGDGMMALFGAPDAAPRKERAAVEAGRDLLAAMAALTPEGQEGGRSLSIGVGIATGPAFVGDIEAFDRRIWTAVGNTINLAARLQALTRDLDAAMIVDAATWRAAGYVAADFVRRAGVVIRGLTRQDDLYLLPSSSSALRP
jgi:class 3 adenylate cyclase